MKKVNCVYFKEGICNHGNRRGTFSAMACCKVEQGDCSEQRKRRGKGK